MPLTSLQLIGLKYYEDLCKKIPRSEVQEITNIVQRAINTLFSENGLLVETVGSFRRGKSMCGDVDILITMKDEGFLSDPSHRMTKHEEL